MMLAKFKSAQAAFQFRRQLNNKPFDATKEEEICRILFVDKIEFHMSEEPDYFCTSSESSRELPLCSICLERLDAETSGVFTPVCRHALHLSCKSKLDHSSYFFLFMF